MKPVIQDEIFCKLMYNDSTTASMGNLATGENNSTQFTAIPYIAFIEEIELNGLNAKELQKPDLSANIAKDVTHNVPLVEREFAVQDEVSATAAESKLSDEEAVLLVEDVTLNVRRQKPRSKAIINVDTLCKNFEAGDTVNLAALRQKGLVPKKTDYIKVLGRGVLNKPLIVEADDFTVNAIKMIVLTGGRVLHIV